jgi:hypothetical protein
MHSSRKKEKTDARKSRLSGENPECPGNPDTLGKFPDSPGVQHTSEKTTFTKIFNLA